MKKVKLSENNKMEYVEMYIKYTEELKAYDSTIESATEEIALSRDKNINSEVVLFEEENNIIGFAILGTGLPNSFCGHDVFIEEFYVKKEYRRKGYGTEMVRLIVDSYPSMDFSAFILEYNTIAIEFWEKVFDFLGYSERTSVGNIRAKGNNTVFKYWALYLPF